jgi:hypothetical protein
MQIAFMPFRPQSGMNSHAYWHEIWQEKLLVNGRNGRYDSSMQKTPSRGQCSRHVLDRFSRVGCEGIFSSICSHAASPSAQNDVAQRGRRLVQSMERHSDN